MKTRSLAALLVPFSTCLVTTFLVATFLVSPSLVNTAHGQHRVVNQDESSIESASNETYAPERAAIEDLLLSIVGLVKEVATDANTAGITQRLNDMTSRLSSIAQTSTFKSSAIKTSSVNDQSAFQSDDSGITGIQTRELRADELEQLEQVLRDVLTQLVEVRHELHIDGRPELASKTESMEAQLLDGLALVRAMKKDRSANDQTNDQMRRYADQDVDDRLANDRIEDRTDGIRTRRNRSTSDGYLRPGTYRDDSISTSDLERDEVRGRDEQFRDEEYGDDSIDDGWSDSDDSWTTRERRSSEGSRRSTRKRGATNSRDFAKSSNAFATYVGEFRDGWPFRDMGVYRTAPAIRYNRVDGLVLGIRKLPLAWDSWDRSTIYGHGGYAIASKRWQYEIGAESRLFSKDSRNFDLKLGGSYRQATTTDDAWKSSWLENTTGALLFNYDFFDYYETSGFTGYASIRATPYVQITGAYRSEKQTSLVRETTWSLFGGDNFTFNPAVTEGRMNSALVVVEGGSVKDYEWLPRGVAFRVEGEIGDGLGGDFSYNRVVADGRVYLPMGRASTLALRVRGGTSDGVVPYQKLFRIGGIGSVRSYAQNTLTGTRMLVGNAEYMFAPGLLSDEITFSLFADGGWTNDLSNTFKLDDVFPTAGVGAGLLEQSVRVELAWPLDSERAGTTSPSLWIRLARSF